MLPFKLWRVTGRLAASDKKVVLAAAVLFSPGLRLGMSNSLRHSENRREGDYECCDHCEVCVLSPECSSARRERCIPRGVDIYECLMTLPDVCKLFPPIL